MRKHLLFLVCFVPVAWAGCSSDRAEIGGSSSGEFTDDAGREDAACTGVVCSRDLRSVRDCSGKVIKECDADQACGNGECIAPCDAAAVNAGSVGCSFAVPAPNNSTEWDTGSCYAVFIANNWTSPATLSFEHKGEPRSIERAAWVPSEAVAGSVTYTKLDGPIPPGGSAVVFVSQEQNAGDGWVPCPKGVEPIFDKELSVYGTGIGVASFIRSDRPVSMYSMYPYDGAKSHAASATLLFPTTSFRTNYILVSAWGGRGDLFGKGVFPLASAFGLQAGRPTVQIVATENDTSVQLLPKVDIVGDGEDGVVPAVTRDTVASFRLQRGEVLQLTQQNELVGSVLDSDKPVGVFGGHTCLNVPMDIAFCDFTNNQIPPVAAWGSEYAVMPAPNRSELASKRTSKEKDPSPIRLVGAIDATELVYEPSRPAGAPTTLGQGQLAVFFANDPFVVRSQDRSHPFFAAALMTGSFASGTMLGDPEVMIQVPTEQWLDTYGFYSDYTYMLSAVYVTRRKSEGAFRDVILDCAGPLTQWQPLNADYEWTFVELTRNRAPQTYPAGTCSDGAHKIRSDGPFSMSVWGISPAGSYGYAGGAGLRPLTEVHVPVH